MANLYHFTSRVYLPAILREGITRGDVATLPEEGFCAPTLTKDSSWESQEWAQGEVPILDKTAVRLTVRIPPPEKERLFSWAQVIQKYHIPDWWRKTQGQHSPPDDWYVFMGRIPRSWITRVEIRPDTEPFSWEPWGDKPVIARLSYSTPEGSGKVGRVTKKMVTLGELLTGLGHWPLPPTVDISSPNPWTHMPFRLLRTLAEAHPLRTVECGEAWCKMSGVSECWDLAAGLSSEFYAAGICRWLHGPRRMIDISKESFNLLEEYEPRFSWLPEYDRDAPWKQGALFRYNRPNGNLAIYAEPCNQGGFPGIKYTAWFQSHGSQPWSPLVYLHPSRKESLLEGTREEWLEWARGELPEDRMMRWTSLEQHSRENRLTIAADGTRLDSVRMLHVTVNALTALHEQPRLLVGERKKARRKKRVGAVSRVQRLTLTPDGTRLITRRWVTKNPEEPAPLFTVGNRRPPCLHTVEPHDFRVWVRRPLAHEKVLNTKERTNKKGQRYFLFQVRRKRGKEGAFARGGSVIPKQAKMVTGIADL